jgi:alkylation response protein AidB-like acyl-CoA dehydrogenase
MRFHLSSEQELLQDSIRRAVRETCAEPARRAIIDAADDYSPALWSTLVDLGVAGIVIPEAYGGTGLAILDAALAAESLGECAAPGPLLSHLLATYALVRSPWEEKKQSWLPLLASGQARAAFAFAGGWRPETWEGELVDGAVSATAPFVQGAAGADLYVLGLSDGRLGIVTSKEGVSLTPHNSVDRTRRVSRVDFSATPCAVICDDPASAQAVFDFAAIMLAADALGGAQTCLHMAIEYAKTRVQFGQPIASFQAIRHELADMAVELEPARALVWYAAHAMDAGLPDRARAAALAKAHLCDRFTSLARHAVMIHGGLGYTWEYDLQIWFRRALADHAYLGAPGDHRRRAGELAGW